MNLLRLIPAAILVASAGLALAASAPAPSSSSSRRSSTPPAPAPGDYENFRIIAERNIFNPNRIGRVREGGDGPAAPREDVLTLVGTLRSADRWCGDLRGMAFSLEGRWRQYRTDRKSLTGNAESLSTTFGTTFVF